MNTKGLIGSGAALMSAAVIAGCAGSVGGTGEAARGQMVLFDGRSLDGWEQVGPGRFVPQPDGSILSDGGMGLLYYAERPFRDFVLELEYRAESREANSGIFLRFPEPPTDPWDAVRAGYEIQIDDSAGDPIHATGAVYSFSAPFRIASRPVGEWNRYRIEVTGQRYQVHLNGERVNDFFGERGREGFIGLQNHDANSRVHFRNIRVTPVEVADPPMSMADLVAVREQRQPIRVLMLTATHGWRHHEGIAAARALMRDVSRTTEFQVDLTENLDDLSPSNLARYDVLFFAQSSLRAAPQQSAGAPETDTYTISIHTPQGVRTGELRIAGEPGRWSGSVTIGGADRLPLEAPAYSDGTLTFGFAHPQIGRVRATAQTLGRGLVGTATADGAEMPLTGNRYNEASRHLGGYTPVSEAQRQAILGFLAAGKGVAVAHAGLDAFQDWSEYREMVGGGLFREHPWVQPVRITVEEPADPLVSHLGDGFWLRDEIYVLDRNPRSASRVLLTLDMPSVGRQQGARGADTDDYPISWTRTHGNGRVFVTSLGHFPDVWGTPDFVRHLLQGMRFAAGRPTPTPRD